ncbi:MAG TPA: hypothetical protein VGE07_27295 [Herpetosiphonaceae bacterium]
MRIAALIVALLGALFAGALGSLAVQRAGENLAYFEKQTGMTLEAAVESGVPSAAEALAEVGKQRNAGYALFAGAAAGLIGGILAFMRQGKIAAALMIVVALAPLLFLPAAMLGTAGLILAALLSFFVKPAGAALPASGFPAA